MKYLIVNIGTIKHVDHGRTTLTAAIANTKLGKFAYKFCTQWIEYINEPISVSLVKQGKTLKEHNNIMALNKKKI